MMRVAMCLTVCVAAIATAAIASGGQQAAVQDVESAISRLGDLDYQTRMNAARVLRRAPEAQVVPALADAVRTSTDQFVRYRSLVILTGFGGRVAGDLVQAVLSDRNDRVREVAYRWLAARPSEGSTLDLLAALGTEQAEFVRPALVRALAARAQDPAVQRALISEVSRGLDFFRLAVIDALGEFKAAYAVDALLAAARIDGPLQDDAVMALGRIGDVRASTVIVSLDVPRDVEPAVQGALCLFGDNCDVRIQWLADTAVASGARPEVARACLTALTLLGTEGSEQAMSALAGLARASRVQQQAGVAFGGVALRAPSRMLTWLAAQTDALQEELIDVLRVAFERFEEDFSEEQFFAAARAAYWQAPDGSPGRSLMAQIIQRLDF